MRLNSSWRADKGGVKNMIEQILAFLENIGMAGLYAAIFIEGSSLPFPGIVVVLAYGGILNLAWPEMLLASASMAAVYSAASLLPYFLGDRMEHLLRKKFRKGIERARRLFNRYGLWSIALSRPFGIGNYISYLAGMSRVGIVKYLVLTFAGIFPWCFSMLFLGDYFNGNYERFKAFYDDYSYFVYGGIFILASVLLWFSFRKFKKKEAK